MKTIEGDTMKTSVIEVHDMLSVLSVDEVEKRIGEVPGVASATVNFAAGNITVRYDETRLEVADIKSAVRQRGYESAAPAEAATGGHEGHTAPGAPPATPAPAVPKAPLDAAASTTPKPPPAASAAAPAAPKSAPAAAAAAPAGDKQQDKTAPDKN
jgi:copper chaperone CopZ